MDDDATERHADEIDALRVDIRHRVAGQVEIGHRLLEDDQVGLGLAKGDRVAVLAYNAVEWMEIYAATAKAGLVMVPVVRPTSNPPAAVP